MKTLPDNPNLDHLRQQAKDLLAGLRDSEPTAKLSDAQAALAERYGFRTWTELKAEVDRRRGHADVADPVLARAIAARYGLGKVVSPMRALARPDETGRQWSLETDQGRWLAQSVDGAIRIVDVETEIALQQAAMDQGILLPAPVRSEAGGIIESVDGHQWRVNEWLHSGPTLVAPVSAATTRSVGEILAKLHRLALPVDRLSPWGAARFSQVEWSKLAETAHARGASWAPALARMVPTLVELSAVGQGVPAPAPVLSHNGLGPGVVRLGPDGRLVVAGWEYAGGQPPSWELAAALADWAVDSNGDVNVAGVRAMVAGYRSLAGSPPPMDIAAFRGHATGIMNYLDGLAYAAMEAADVDDRVHASRSVRHLLAHLPSRDTYERMLEITHASV
jgi:Ser/Thr protein kinase RdoA (MazF antagonist)